MSLAARRGAVVTPDPRGFDARPRSPRTRFTTPLPALNQDYYVPETFIALFYHNNATCLHFTLLSIYYKYVYQN